MLQNNPQQLFNYPIKLLYSIQIYVYILCQDELLITY